MNKFLVISGASLLVLLAAMPLLRAGAECIAQWSEAARLSRSLSRARRSGL